MGDPGVEQNALGRRRLSGVDVRHDSNIPAAIQRYLASHDVFSLLLSGFHWPEVQMSFREQLPAPTSHSFSTS
jgi:hypothetical protein